MSLKMQILPTFLMMLLCSEFDPLQVNSTADCLNPGEKVVTLRSALDLAADGDVITFGKKLDGATIELSLIAEEHTLLKGEVMGIRMEPSGPVSYLVGYFDRDYGRSALYARKNVVIDASALPHGITIKWVGGVENSARVLAVYGDLTLNNVRLTGGRSVAQNIQDQSYDQPWTLARGGGAAVWGKATIIRSEMYDNHCQGDFDDSRDRGAFGGGLYADIVHVEDSVISGNTVTGAGAAGGGVYSVGGAESLLTSSAIIRTAVSDNSISGIFTYGGGVFTDGGSIGNRKMLKIQNSTIARNLVRPVPGLPPFLNAIGYWRGGGIYMSNGFLTLQSSTVVENEVRGYQRTGDLDKSNMAGGIAATIGNAHAVEEMVIGHSIIAGNRITELKSDGSAPVTANHDIFTGSLLHFKSRGYNRIGVVDFSQILVPVGQVLWRSLSRKHYPQAGDEAGVLLDDVVDNLHGVTFSDHIFSWRVNGRNQPESAVLSYLPRGSSLDQVSESYDIKEHYYEYDVENGNDTFLAVLLSRLQDTFNLPGFAGSFTNQFESYLQSVDTDMEEDGLQPYSDPDGNPIVTLAQTRWFGPSQTWPSELANYAYIEFWHRLDRALENEDIAEMGPEILGDAVWGNLFSPGSLVENEDITILHAEENIEVTLLATDQYGRLRPLHDKGDIGAIELE